MNKNMFVKYIDIMISWSMVALLFLVCCVSPWFFGAWETWWFWPFVVLLAFSAVLAGSKLLLGGCVLSKPVRTALFLYIPFLVYVLLRWWLGTAVYLDAERKFILYLSGAWIAILVAGFLKVQHIRFLFWLLYGSLFFMSVYGILNHIFTGSRLVLWAPRYEQYAGRATGPYFCPDHFAGAMEIFICMGLALVLDRSRFFYSRLLGVVACGLGTVGALMSLSRGAGMTLLVISLLVVVLGFFQWPLPVRNWWRLTCFSGAVFILLCAFVIARPYRERFVSYGGLHQVSATESEHGNVYSEILDRLRRTSRGRMYVGAWRAWQSAPWLGTGLGMHRHLWPAFADSGDGNRDTGQWPTLINDNFHSYEVHSDWLELLQELGVVGFVLFSIALCGVARLLLLSCRDISVDWQQNELDYAFAPPNRGYSLILSSLFVMGAMAFHSLGDFNLQMPGTVWMVGLAVGWGLHAASRLEFGENAGC